MLGDDLIQHGVLGVSRTIHGRATHPMVLGACRRNAKSTRSTSRPSHFGPFLRIVARENGPQTGLPWGSHPTFLVYQFHSDRLLVPIQLDLARIMGSPAYAVPKGGQHGQLRTAADADARRAAGVAGESEGSAIGGPTPRSVSGDRRGRPRRHGRRGGRARGLQRDHGVRVGASVQRERLHDLRTTAPSEGTGAACGLQRGPASDNDRLRQLDQAHGRGRRRGRRLMLTTLLRGRQGPRRGGLGDGEPRHEADRQRARVPACTLGAIRRESIRARSASTRWGPHRRASDRERRDRARPGDPDLRRLALLSQHRKPPA
jgi:hypothetical protein